jgi:hypothetical protein
LTPISNTNQFSSSATAARLYGGQTQALKTISIGAAAIFVRRQLIHLWSKQAIRLEGLTPALLYQNGPQCRCNSAPGMIPPGAEHRPELVKDVKALINRFDGPLGRTPLYEFDGDLSKMEFLKLGISNVVHSIGPVARYSLSVSWRPGHYCLTLIQVQLNCRS